jgi:tellurite resistance protein TehA-like permease
LFATGASPSTTLLVVLVLVLVLVLVVLVLVRLRRGWLVPKDANPSLRIVAHPIEHGRPSAV